MWCCVAGGVLFRLTGVSLAGVIGDWTELLWACFGHGFLVVLCGCLVGVAFGWCDVGFGVWAVLGAWL